PNTCSAGNSCFLPFLMGLQKHRGIPDSVSMETAPSHHRRQKAYQVLWKEEPRDKKFSSRAVLRVLRRLF
ncbi:mCG146141, partial [Mus musculus]